MKKVIVAVALFAVVGLSVPRAEAFGPAFLKGLCELTANVENTVNDITRTKLLKACTGYGHFEFIPN